MDRYGHDEKAAFFFVGKSERRGARSSEFPFCDFFRRLDGGVAEF